MKPRPLPAALALFLGSAALTSWASAAEPASVRHWAYARPVRPPLPGVAHPRWPRHGLDYFVLARLEKEQLTPAPEAEPARLPRRVSLDLTGLPPTVEEVD